MNLSIDPFETIFFDKNYHIMYTSPSRPLQILSWISIFLILLTNGHLIFFFLKQNTKTFLDWLVMFDCILSAANILSIITVGVVGPANVQMFGDCYFPVLSVLFINICKRYLSLGLFCEIHVHQHVSMSNL